jgi:hypothetical protein
MTTKSQRQRIAELARNRCGYCLLQEVVSGIPLTIEHLLPKAHGGGDEDENLWLSCRLCNERKGTLVQIVDPDGGELVPLSNPRTDRWDDHFCWSTDGAQILAKTAVGRATVVALALNDELRVRAQAIWVKSGWHPPKP